MTWFIEVTRINGRRELCEFVDRIAPNGFGDRIEYSNGGWFDREPGSIAPHLKFDYEDDAIAYSLAFGGKVLSHRPLRFVDP